MEVTYRRDGEQNYMVWKAPEDLQGNEYQVRMLLVNEIPGLLRCRLRKINGDAYLYYEITSKQPLTRVFEHRAAGAEDIRALALSLRETLEGIARYLLPDDGIVLEPEFIYMDLETKEMRFCYLPFCGEEIRESFRRLAEYLLKSLDHEEEQAVLWGYQLYSKTAEENYRVRTALESLRGRLEPVKKEKAGKEKRNVRVDEEKQNGSERGGKNRRQPVSQQMPGQEWLQKKEKNRRAVTLGIIAALCLTGCAALAVFQVLTLTQTGGILFLIAGVFYYLFAGKTEGSKEQGEEKRGKSRRERISIWKENKKNKRIDRTRKAAGSLRNENREQEEDKIERITAQERRREFPGGKPEPEELAEEEICDFQEESEEASCDHPYRPMEEIYGQTTLLGKDTAGRYPVLVSSNPGVRENVEVRKERFVIGKLKGQTDLTLNLPVVSRMHAEIEHRDGKYFLVDLNSTNGTYLNGERLEANEYRQLHSGDEVIFAGAAYYFR